MRRLIAGCLLLALAGCSNVPATTTLSVEEQNRISLENGVGFYSDSRTDADSSALRQDRATINSKYFGR